MKHIILAIVIVVTSHVTGLLIGYGTGYKSAIAESINILKLSLELTTRMLGGNGGDNTKTASEGSP